MQPEIGEVWINIHTSKQGKIVRLEESFHARGRVVVIYNEPRWKRQRCDIVTFCANWKRSLKASQWYLGVFE